MPRELLTPLPTGHGDFARVDEPTAASAQRWQSFGREKLRIGSHGESAPLYVSLLVPENSSRHPWQSWAQSFHLRAREDEAETSVTSVDIPVCVVGLVLSGEFESE